MNQKNQQTNSPEFDIQYYIAKYLFPVIEHKWILLISVLFFTALAVTFSLFIKPVYSSSATIQLEQFETDSNDIGRVIDDSAIFAAAIENMSSFSFRTRIIKNSDVTLKQDLEAPLDIPGQIKVLLYPLIKENVQILMEKIGIDNTIDPDVARLKKEKKNKQRQISRLLHRMKIHSNRSEGTIKITGSAFDPKNASMLVEKYIELWEEDNLNNLRDTIQKRLDIARSQQQQKQEYLDEAVKKDFSYRQSIGIPIDRMVVPDPGMQIQLNMLHHAISRSTDTYNNANIVVQSLERLSRSVHNNIIVINPSQVPLYPTVDKRMVIILIGIIIGMLTGTLPILTWEYYRGYIRHEKDILYTVDIPVIGSLPTIK